MGQDKLTTVVAQISRILMERFDYPFIVRPEAVTVEALLCELAPNMLLYGAVAKSSGLACGQRFFAPARPGPGDHNFHKYSDVLSIWHLCPDGFIPCPAYASMAQLGVNVSMKNSISLYCRFDHNLRQCKSIDTIFYRGDICNPTPEPDWLPKFDRLILKCLTARLEYLSEYVPRCMVTRLSKDGLTYSNWEGV